MSDLTGIFEALYSRLLLRDFFGKMIPGTIVILSVCIVTLSPWEVQKYIQAPAFFPSLFFFGLAWIIAFAIQAIGEKIHLIRYHNYATNKEFYIRRYKFHKGTKVLEHQQLERLVVIKEACGNGYIALGFSIVLLCVNTVVTKGFHALIDYFRIHWLVIVFVIILTVFLAIMHFTHVKRQDEYIDAILDALGPDSSK